MLVDDMNVHPDRDGLYRRIAELARELHGTPRDLWRDADQLGRDVTTAAIELLPCVDHAAITIITTPGGGTRRAELRSTATTGPVPEAIDDIQHTVGEGPCVDAPGDPHTVRIDDLARDHRWPRFAAAVLEHTPVRALLVSHLYTDGHQFGALALYCEEPNCFTPDTDDLAHNLATHAAIALSGSQRGQQFRSALASRDIIGQAKGMIMQRFSIDAIAAFDLLRRLSQDTNTPLADLATQLTTTDTNR